MRITVLGAGALGGYFGARLQSTGHDVTYVARGSHLEAMQKGGLRVESPEGDLQFDKVRAVATPAEAGPADLVLFMVKNYDVEDAARALAPTLAPGTRILTAQNGVSAQGLLADIVGPSHVLPGAVYMPADLKAPGVIRHSAAFHRIVFGEFGGAVSPEAEAVREAIAATGIDVTLASDIWAVLWNKFIMMAPNSAITALTRLDIGPIRKTPETRELLMQLIVETAAVAQAEHPAVSDEGAEAARDFLLNTAPPTMHASMLDDLNRGKRLELDWLSGEVIRRGAALGIPTPAHGFAYAALAPFAHGAPDTGP